MKGVVLAGTACRCLTQESRPVVVLEMDAEVLARRNDMTVDQYDDLSLENRLLRLLNDRRLIVHRMSCNVLHGAQVTQRFVTRRFRIFFQLIVDAGPHFPQGHVGWS